MTATAAQGRYAPVDGLSIYYEVHGDGPPLVLLHGGLLTIGLNFGGILAALAERHRVVAIELQGHGRTADSDRPLSLERLADDVAEVMTHANVERADVLGFSLGGLVSVEIARRHPDRVRRLVLASMEKAYRAAAPDPDHFDTFAAKASTWVGSLPGWSEEELRQITAPALVILGDTDFVRVEHAAHMQSVLPEAQLAVIPGATHMGLFHEADIVLPILGRFLDD